jgi:hypothetical protein
MKQRQKIRAQGQSRQKLAETCLKNKPGVVVHAYNPSYMGDRGRRTEVQSQSRQNLTQKTKPKSKTGGEAQVAEPLPSKHEPLS